MTKINLNTVSKETVQEALLKSSNKTELALNLGFNYINGKVHKKVIKLIEKFSLSISHFDPSKKARARRKYPIIKKICPACQKEFETEDGHPKEATTCSYKCSNIFFSNIKQTDQSRLKRSQSLLIFNESSARTELVNGEILFKLNCIICGESFYSKKSSTQSCSKICFKELQKNVSSETREKISNSVNRRIANGTHNGWSSRSKLESSYPEKYTSVLLEELNVFYTRELKVNKWFIDFADATKKLALEIDGKQHELPERKASDEKKDAYLIANGWQVLRIKWKKPTKEFRELMIDQIKKFFISV